MGRMDEGFWNSILDEETFSSGGDKNGNAGGRGGGGKGEERRGSGKGVDMSGGITLSIDNDTEMA